MVKCPHCNGFMEIDDVFDVDFFDSSYYNKTIGTCSECGRTYKWTEQYDYVGYDDVEEITEDDD